MKLLRYGEAGREKPGLVGRDGRIRDLSGHVDDIGGRFLDPDALAALGRVDEAGLPAVEGRPRIGPCVAGVGKFICIGLNYSDHAAETGATVPPEPIIFMKATSAIVGPNDRLVIPRGSEKTDWEVELGVVIGRTAKYVSEAEALDHVAGWGNSIGTPDYRADPQNLPMWLSVNGETMQNGSTRTMVYGAAFLVSYLSQFMSLHPGDIISTGTPPGVGMGMKPPRYLKPGDIVELGIEGLGTQRQECVADR